MGDTAVRRQSEGVEPIQRGKGTMREAEKEINGKADEGTENKRGGGKRRIEGEKEKERENEKLQETVE